METSPSLGPQQVAVKRQLERALAESTDPEVRFHIRQALQLIA
jgi:hypothetical protein